MYLSNRKLTKTDLVKHINDNKIELREVVDIGESAREDEWSDAENMKPEDAFGPSYIAERADEIADEAEREDRELDINEAEEIAIQDYYENPIIKTVSNYGYTITGNDDLGYQIFENEVESQ